MPSSSSDMDAALEIASSQRGAPVPRADRLPVVRRSAAAPRPARSRRRSAFLDRVIDPFLDRYGKPTAIHSFDLINEPDWVIDGAGDRSRSRGVAARSPANVRRACCRRASARVRRRWSRWAAAASRPCGNGIDPAYDLDFLQVHSYPDVRYPDRDDSVFGRTAAELRVEQAAADRRVPVASARSIRRITSRPRTRSRTT